MHNSNCFLEYFPFKTPARTAIRYISLSSRSIITPMRFRESPRPLSTIVMGTVTLSPCLLGFQENVVRGYTSPCALLAEPKSREHVFSDFGVDPYGLVLMARAVLCHPPW